MRLLFDRVYWRIIRGFICSTLKVAFQIRGVDIHWLWNRLAQIFCVQNRIRNRASFRSGRGGSESLALDFDNRIPKLPGQIFILTKAKHIQKTVRYSIMSVIRQIRICFAWSSFVLGSVFNIVLIWLIHRHTPQVMRVYSKVGSTYQSE